METKILRKDDILLIEEVEYDPDDTNRSYYGKIINKTNNLISLHFSDDDNDCLYVYPQEHLMLNRGEDDYEWTHIVNNNYEIFVVERGANA